MVAKKEVMKEAFKETPKPDSKPMNPVLKEGCCIHCQAPVAPGQTYVCVKHQHRG